MYIMSDKNFDNWLSNNNDYLDFSRRINMADEIVSNVGLEGTGCEIEFEIVHETERAYKLTTDFIDDCIWLPKSGFNDDGYIYEWAHSILVSKMEEDGYAL